LASVGERPDLEAFRELEEVLRHLAEELAGWRRRALQSEARVAEATRVAGDGDGGLGRIEELEGEHHEMERRLGTARTQVLEILGRLQFLEQQRGGSPGERA